MRILLSISWWSHFLLLDLFVIWIFGFLKLFYKYLIFILAFLKSLIRSISSVWVDFAEEAIWFFNIVGRIQFELHGFKLGFEPLNFLFYFLWRFWGLVRKVYGPLPPLRLLFFLSFCILRHSECCYLLIHAYWATFRINNSWHHAPLSRR